MDDETPLQQRGYTAEEPGEVWRNTLDLMRDLERYRAEHGPFLRELRCTALVSRYLAVKLPRGEATGYATMTGVPVLVDEEVPVGKMRLVYDDGTTHDIQIFEAAAESGVEKLVQAFEIPFPPIEFKRPPVSNWMGDYLRRPGYAGGGDG